MIYAVLIAALLVKPHKASFVFVAVATMFEIVCGNQDGFFYFPLAALCDFLVTGLLFNLRIDRKVIDMMMVSVASLALNLAGWVAWYLYEPPDLYVTSFGILYMVTIAVMLKKDGADVGGTELYIDYACYYPHVNSGHRICYQSKGTL